MIKDHGIFPLVIIFLILITLSLDNVWILLGENCFWSLLALKGLNASLLIVSKNGTVASDNHRTIKSGPLVVMPAMNGLN